MLRNPSIHPSNNRKQEAPARASPDRGQMGGGSSPRSLSHADIWRPCLSMAAGFPTLFSTASGVCGLVAGPSSTLRLLDFE